MAVFASDDFSSGTAGDNLTTDALWVNLAGTAIYSNAARARQSGTTTWAYYRDNAPVSADYSAQATIRALTVISNASIGVGVRCQVGAHTLYRARAQVTTNTLRLEKVVAGVTTLIASAAITISTSIDYTISLGVAGSALTADFNGTVINDTDSAITTAGFAGIAGTSGGGSSNTTGWHLDNFQADEAGGGTDGTANGVTVTATSSLIAGAASTAVTAAGAILTAVTSMIAGAASAIRNETALGALITVTASMIAGTASAFVPGTGGAWMPTIFRRRRR